jgi:hypothetical protein
MGKPDSKYYSCRKEQISLIVLYDQIFYFQEAWLWLTEIRLASIIMALLASRAGIFLLLNVSFLICVPFLVLQLS